MPSEMLRISAFTSQLLLAVARSKALRMERATWLKEYTLVSVLGWAEFNGGVIGQRNVQR